jgi:hypothetical protein
VIIPAEDESGDLATSLPAAEQVLWQGASAWGSLAREVFHVRLLAAYFAAILASRVLWVLHTGSPLEQALLSALWLLPLGVAAIGLLAALAWLTGRTTAYTVTDRRVVMRIGVALPMTINIPFRIIEAAGLKIHADGSGDIPLALTGNDRIAYVHLWPHVRPWHFTRTEPMLRAVPNAAAVGAIIARALAAYAKNAARPELVRAAVPANTAPPAVEARPLAAAAR